MIADRQTHTRTHTQAHRHAHHKTPLPHRGRIKILGVFLVSEQVRRMFGSHESLMNIYYTRANTVGRHLFRSCRLVLARDGRHVGWCRPTRINTNLTSLHIIGRHSDLSAEILLTLFAWYAEQGLRNCRASVCPSVDLSVPPIILLPHAAQQQMRAVSRLQPP